jgi:hypothetical protein
MGMENDVEELVNAWSSYVQDAEQLIQKLGVDTSVHQFTHGSARFRLVHYAYDRLAQAERGLAGPERITWETTRAANGRDGHFLMDRLWKILLRLKESGEGPPRHSNSN